MFCHGAGQERSFSVILRSSSSTKHEEQICAALSKEHIYSQTIDTRNTARQGWFGQPFLDLWFEYVRWLVLYCRPLTVPNTA